MLSRWHQSCGHKSIRGIESRRKNEAGFPVQGVNERNRDLTPKMTPQDSPIFDGFPCGCFADVLRNPGRRFSQAAVSVLSSSARPSVGKCLPKFNSKSLG